MRGPIDLTFRIWRNLSENTLLSGVFLDGIVPPQPVPGRAGDDYAGPALKAAASAYEAWAAAVAADPLSSLGRPVEAQTVSDDLARFAGAATQPLLPAADRSAALWMLGECYRMAGRHASSEAAFDGYVAALVAAHTGSEPNAYEALAEALYSAGWETDAVFGADRRRALEPEDRRLNRLWIACLTALAEEHEGAATDLVEPLSRILLSNEPYVTGLAKRKAFSLLQARAAADATRPDLLAAVAMASAADGEEVRATELLEQALAAEVDESRFPRRLADLLRMQVRARVRVEESAKTYERLAAFADDDVYAPTVRAGLLDLAWGYYHDGQYARVLELIEEYRTKYPPSLRVDRLEEFCNERMPSAM